jgi:hypothetical protein
LSQRKKDGKFVGYNAKRLKENWCLEEENQTQVSLFLNR